MRKLTIIVCCLFTLLSCAKTLSVPKNSTDDESKNHTFYSYGLKGDGITDVTDSLQKLLNDSSSVYLKAGTYIINRTINLKPGTRLIGEAGTTIKGGKSISGTLLENGRFIFAEKSDNSVIQNITFSQPESAFSFKDWNNSCIFVLHTRNLKVENCLFDFHLNYQNIGMEAVWVSGSGSKNNIILNNEVNTLGIRYAENGADSTRVEANVLTKAYANALSATGNNDADFIQGCKVLNNRILDAGRMGIEDWGNTDGSIIQGNSITGTGKDPKQAIDGIALSAVGKNTSVIKNTIKNGQIYGIEVRGNYGVLVSENDIYSGSSTTGVILNYTFAPPASNLPTAIVKGNKISSGKIGLHIFGDYESNANISKNYFINNTVKSISIESGAKNYLIELKNNSFNFSIPNTEDRFALFTYTQYAPKTANQVITLNADTIKFSSSSAGGKGVDFGLVIRTDNAKIENLQVQANGNKNANKIPVNAISAFGAKPVNAIINNSTVLGGIVDLQGFENPSLKGNNF